MRLIIPQNFDLLKNIIIIMKYWSVIQEDQFLSQKQFIMMDTPWD